MSSLNLNKVVLCGRLTADPELKQTTSGIAVVSFTLAVNRRFQAKGADGAPAQQQADFISVVAWRQTADFIHNFFKKGSSICLTGSIQVRSWNDQQGNKRQTTEVVVDEAFFVDSKTEGAQGAFEAPSFQTSQAPKFEEVASDDDLPF